MLLRKKVIKIGSSYGIILDKVFLNSNGINENDEIIIEIKKIEDTKFTKKIAIKCPRCGEIFVVKSNDEVADCPVCDTTILNEKFNIVSYDIDERREL